MIFSFDLNNMPKINLIGHSVCTKEWKLPLRTNQDYELIVLYQGEVIFLIMALNTILRLATI